MEKFQTSQCAKILLILLLLLITPLLSSSMRPPYLYLLFNILILALGAESGVLSALSKPQEDKKQPSPGFMISKLSDDKKPITLSTFSTAEYFSEKAVTAAASSNDLFSRVKIGAVEKDRPAPDKVVKKVKKCPSMPSLFFIGEGLEEEAEEEEEEEEEVGGVLTGQELFTKAEMFIGNFYNQLKIQREESWKKIHGLYNKAF